MTRRERARLIRQLAKAMLRQLWELFKAQK